MKIRFSAVVLFLIGLLCLTQAQVPMTGAGLGAPGGAAPFQGLGDLSLTGVKAYHSCARAYSAAYAAALGNMCIIADAATGATTCTLVAAATGFVNLTGTYCPGSTTPSAFCAANTSCVVKRFYDQSGATACNTTVACDVSQATAANMPALTFSALSGLPCATFSAASVMTSAATLTINSQPISQTMVARIQNSGGNNNIFGDSSGGFVFYYPGSANTVSFWGGGSIGNIAASSASFHMFQAGILGATSLFAVGSSQSSVSTGGDFYPTTSIEFGFSGFVGVLCEASVISTQLSGANMTSVYNNANSASGGYNGNL